VASLTAVHSPFIEEHGQGEGQKDRLGEMQDRDDQPRLPMHAALAAEIEFACWLPCYSLLCSNVAAISASRLKPPTFCASSLISASRSCKRFCSEVRLILPGAACTCHDLRTRFWMSVSRTP
jgi:hypothetical protein